MAKKLLQSEVLCYSTKPRSRSTVRRHYLDWRAQSNFPLRCDFEDCKFFLAALEWNGQKLDLILDHVDGNNLNNHHDNLRLICPNCDSQLPTKGGKNINRIQNSTESSYQINHKNGRVDAVAFIGGVEAKAKLGNIGK